MSQNKFSRADINAILENPVAIEVGIVRLWQLQTQDEQIAAKTRYSNNVGFSGVHARRGTHLAQWLLGLNGRGHPRYKFKHLNAPRCAAVLGFDNPLAVARSIVLKHSQQLTNIANGKIQLPENPRAAECIKWIKHTG